MSPTDERTPLGCLYHWERTCPNDVHFTQPVGNGRVVEYTWREIMREVRSMAAHLLSLGLPERSRIAILGKNSAHWIMADWAIWMAGHVTVPLYPTLSAETARYTLEHSESSLLFLGKLDNWERVSAGVPEGVPVITLPLAPKANGDTWESIVARTPPLQGEPDRPLDDLATIVYTSGSTGLPKGVMHSFRAFNIVGTLMRDILPPRFEDRMLSYLPLAHIAERLVVQNQSTYFGFQVFFAESLETFVEDLRRARPTIFFSVPRLWTKFQSGVEAKLPMSVQRVLFRIPVLRGRFKKKILTQLGLDHVRLAVTGAAPLPQETIAWYRELGLFLVEAYGMSENMAYSHFTRPDTMRVGYVGEANIGVECRLGEQNEILVKSPAQMLGYYKDEERTAECYTPDGFFRTGDMGEIDSAGRLRITGRVKDLFKTSKGKYVAPVPIENKLVAHPKIEVACVCGANQSSAFALVMLGDEQRKTLRDEDARRALERELDELLGQVNATLDPHEKLQTVVVVDEPWTTENGLLTPTMKIRRASIEERYAPHFGRWLQSDGRVIWQS
ncbi:MAG TPA: AMP-binding protein [Polyangiales bacterium]